MNEIRLVPLPGPSMSRKEGGPGLGHGVNHDLVALWGGWTIIAVRKKRRGELEVYYTRVEVNTKGFGILTYYKIKFSVKHFMNKKINGFTFIDPWTRGVLEWRRKTVMLT